VPWLRVALAQVNPTVGDIDGNADLVARWTAHAVAQGAHLVLFPEMVLTGYPIEDLALRHSFVDAARRSTQALARRLADDGYGEVVVVVGTLDRDADVTDGLGVPKGAPQNVAAVLHRGDVVARYAKHHLPNYGVFDEQRYFVPGSGLTTIRVHGVDVAIMICEDLWQEGGPVAAARAAHTGLLLVLNGSPFEREKDDLRLALCRRRADEGGCTLAYVNLVGGQDELVFDGDSIIVDQGGGVVARAPQFDDGVLVADLELPQATAQADGVSPMPITHVTLSDEALPDYPPSPSGVAPPRSDLGSVYAALVTGTRDYVRKNGFSSVIIGLSGGIDSALTAAIAVDALGPENVVGVSMPSDYSSEHSRSDAADLATRTGLDYRTVPIAAMVAAFQDSLSLSGLAEENLQARVRGVTLMALSNAEGHLVLATGNKTELSVGYSTIYGDAVGGYAPIKDVPKMLVWELSRWRNADAEAAGHVPPIPTRSITKPPSAELRPGQLDTDSLPDYSLLDDVLDDYIEHDRGSAELVAAGFEPDLVERVLRMTDAAEYKRRQYPPGPKISVRNFGRDRRLPITNSWREPAPREGPPASDEPGRFEVSDPVDGEAPSEGRASGDVEASQT
jgi:NAD+ synthase (glutamine-hydrolysing)